MANETLRIDIVADNKAAIAGLKETTAQLNNVSVAASKTATAAAASGGAMSKSAVNYQNFGRVLQDLPYGFNAISNNLTQLIPSVGMLGIAFTGVVTALTFMQVGFGAWTRGMGGAGEATDDLKKKMDGFNESAAKEIINFKQLTSVAANANIPLDQRLQAVDDLQKQYPAYLGNLSQEDILAGKIGGAYEQVVTALKAKIALQASEEKLIPIIKEQLTIADEIAQAQKTVAAAAGITAKEVEKSYLNGRNYAKELQAAAVGAAKTIEVKSKAYKELDRQIQKVFSSMSALNVTANALNFAAPKNFGQAVQKDTYGQGFKPQNARREFTVMPERETVDTTKIRVQAGSEYNDILATQITLQEQLNQQQIVANEYATMGASLFTSMGNALLYGQDMGEAFTNTLKKIVLDLTAAIAKALIFKALMAAFTGGGSVVAGAFGGAGGSALGGIGASVANSQGGGSGFFGFLSGNNILMGQNRTRTSMGLRRG